MRAALRALGLAVLLSAGASLALPISDPSDPGGNVPDCILDWSARICASETALRPTQTQNFSASSTTVPFAGITFNAGEVVDLQFSGGTNAGDGALIALLDVNALISANPALGPLLFDAQGKCSGTNAAQTPPCKDAVEKVKNATSDDQIHAAAVWGHECAGASDFPQKTLNGITLSGQHLLVAVAESGSSASVGLSVIRHTPGVTTVGVCGPIASGKFGLAPGNYTNRSIGTLKVPSPQSGGTLGNVHLVMEGTPDPAEGTFSISTTAPGASANLLFTGSSVACQ